MDPLRYPIGLFESKPTYSADERAANIHVIRELPRLLRDTVSSLTDAQLDTKYREGGWTVRQVVHHLGDSHMNGFIRHRLALTETNPRIKPYEEAQWAELPDASAPIDISLRLLEGLHERWALMLKGMNDEQFLRTYIHPASGSWTLEQSLANYAWHSLHHTAHITKLRDRQGW
jgi:hypothetical protein